MNSINCPRALKRSARPSRRRLSALLLNQSAMPARTTATTHTIASAADEPPESPSRTPLAIELLLTLRGGSLKRLPFLLRGFRQRRLFPFLLLFYTPPVAVFAHGAREHVVRQFDTLRAVVFLEPHQPRADQLVEFVVGQRDGTASSRA